MANCGRIGLSLSYRKGVYQNNKGYYNYNYNSTVDSRFSTVQLCTIACVFYQSEKNDKSFIFSITEQIYLANFTTSFLFLCSHVCTHDIDR